MNWRRHAALLIAAVWLAGCATPPPAAPLPSGEPLSGRLSIRVDGTNGAAPRALTATFELLGDARTGRLDLSTPLGSLLAQARWAPGSVALVTPQGERRFDDLDALTREVVGESLPIAALFDWLRGRPWPGAPSTATLPPAEAGFVQLGWTVSLAHLDEASIAARREQAPAVVVRAKLDRP